MHIQDDGVTGVDIYNNTFYGHGTYNINNTYHIWLEGASEDVAIKNNIFYTLLDVDANNPSKLIIKTGAKPYFNIIDGCNASHA